MRYQVKGTNTVVKTDVVTMTGGLNEAVSTLEMKPGEMISCQNYYISEGFTSGYASCVGYERYDGRPLASLTYGKEGNDTAREAARSNIHEVPGINEIRGVFLYKGKVYAIRDKAGAVNAGLFVESTSGWVEVDTTSSPLLAGGRYSVVLHAFTGGTEKIFWASGVDKACQFDGTTVTKITTGMAVDTPKFIDVFNDRLFLTFTDGSLQYSNVGNPLDWATGAGEIGVGFDITGIRTTVGNNLVIFGYNNISLLTGTSTADWVLSKHSDVVGAFPYTIEKIFDTFIFFNTTGITTLSATQEYGDFVSGTLSAKLSATIERYKQSVLCSTVVKDLNQYRLFLTDGTCIVVSFFNKKLRGVSKFKYPIPVFKTITGLDSGNESVNFFISSTGYIYKMDSGTSFDGAEIEHKFTLAYYHYKSPRYWKRFLKILFELYCPDAITIKLRPLFDYNEPIYPKSLTGEFTTTASGGVWGVNSWGSLVLGGNAVTSRISFDTLGIASNMGITFYFKSKYAKQHIFQNMIVDYIILGRQA